MDDPPLASLSLTHVRYVGRVLPFVACIPPRDPCSRDLLSASILTSLQDPSDHLSYLSAWLALVPQALCIIYVTLIWSTREIEVLLMFAGQMACEILNFGLKRLIKEERPQQMHGKGYGMPSSHSQFVSFFSISLTFFLLLRHQPYSLHRDANKAAGAAIYPTYKQSTLLERLLLSVLALTGAASVCASRVYLSYHTPKQVLAGVAAGVIFALAWFMFTTALRRTGWIEWSLETQLARLVRMRDLIVTEDLQDAGWARWDERRKLMKPKKKI